MWRSALKLSGLGWRLVRVTGGWPWLGLIFGRGALTRKVRGWENDRPVQARSARGDTTPHRPTAQAPWPRATAREASRDARPGHRAHSAQEPGRLARS